MKKRSKTRSASKRTTNTKTKTRTRTRGDLPKKLETEWSKIYDAVYDESRDKPHSARIAWYQIERTWTKDKDGDWVLKKSKTRTSRSKTRTAKTRRNCEY